MDQQFHLVEPEARGGSDIRILARLSAVLRLFVAGPPTRRLLDIAAATGLSKATAHRLVTGLCNEDLLQRTEDGGYVLGPLVNTLGTTASGPGALRERARPILQRLTAQTGETSLMFQLAPSGDRAICIEQIESAQGLRLVGTVGVRLPLHAGGASRAILAFMPAASQATILAPFPPRESARLRKQLRTTAQLGYAVSFEETNEGVSGVGVPLFDARHRVMGSIALVGPVTRMHERRLVALAPAVMKAAAEVDGRPLQLQEKSS